VIDGYSRVVDWTLESFVDAFHDLPVEELREVWLRKKDERPYVEMINWHCLLMNTPMLMRIPENVQMLGLPLCIATPGSPMHRVMDWLDSPVIVTKQFREMIEAP
jgi:hypothetical protein